MSVTRGTSGGSGRRTSRCGAVAAAATWGTAAALLVGAPAAAQCDYTVEVIRYYGCSWTSTHPDALGEGGRVGGDFRDCGIGTPNRPFI